MSGVGATIRPGIIPKLHLPNVENDTDPAIAYRGSWNHHSLSGCHHADETFTARNNDHAVIAFEGSVEPSIGAIPIRSRIERPPGILSPFSR